MGRIVVEAKPSMVFDCLNRTMRRSCIERDFCRMHFQREIDVEIIEGIENRDETLTKILESPFNKFLTRGRESVAGVPDAGSGESGNDGWELEPVCGLCVDEIPGSLRSLNQLRGGALTNC